MRAIERTTELFVASVKLACPELRVTVQSSVRPHGRSTYVHLDHPALPRYWKIRISDHPVGMRRAMSGSEQLYLHACARPHSWAVWLGDFRRTLTMAIERQRRAA